MLITLFGDIHGNLDAFDAFLMHLDGLNPDRVYCLGDLVGWLPFGDRTLDRMRSLGFPTVAGNHDLMVAGLFADHPDQLDRMQATAFNAGILSTFPEAIGYLGSLPLRIEENGFTVVHHSPFHLPEPDRMPTIACFGYLDEATLDESLNSWRAFQKRLIFSGHDHAAAVYEFTDGTESPALSDIKVYRPEKYDPLTIRLRFDCRYWVKVGSIGGPYRDGVAASNFATYDTEAGLITLLRLPYSVKRLRQELASHFFARNLPTLQKSIELLEHLEFHKT